MAEVSRSLVACPDRSLGGRNEPRPRALVLTPDFPPAKGGVQLLLHRIVSNWSSLEPTVVTLGPSTARAHPEDSIVVWQVPHTRLGHRIDIARLTANALKTAVSVRPDVILSGHLVMAPAAIAIHRLLGRPFVQYFYGKEVAARPRLASLAIANASAVIAVSSFTAQLAASIRAHPHALIIPPGVDLPRDPPPVARSRHPSTIITVARLADRYKGHDVMLRALPLIRARVPDVSWALVGDGPLRQTYERMAASLGVSDCLALHGEVPDRDRDRLLDSSQVFVMVSRLSPRGEGEGFGIVYLEAGAHGLPVVAGHAGGAGEAVIDGVTGILVEPTDHVAVAGALIDVLTHPETALRMGRAGRAHAAEHTWQRASAEVESLLLDVIARNKRA
jgi:phosphatidylinositol alpha-1,6-mannosyltransferase